MIEIVMRESGTFTLMKSQVSMICLKMGKEVELLEVKGGFLLRPAIDAIREARGILKNKQFSTDVYLRHKIEEKRMEK